MNWEAVSAIAQIPGAIAVFASLVYLAKQISISNRLARAMAHRSPNSDLNPMNATFSTIPIWRSAFRKVLHDVSRSETQEDEQSVKDAYLISLTYIYEQLSREVSEAALDADAHENLGGRNLFSLPYYRSSRPVFGKNTVIKFVKSFEKSNGFNSLIEASL